MPGRWSGMKSNIVTMCIDLLQEGNLNRKFTNSKTFS